MAGKYIKYTDNRPIFLPKLFYYPGGTTLPSGNNEIKVTDKEAAGLFKLKNGEKKCFEIVNKRPVQMPVESEEI